MLLCTVCVYFMSIAVVMRKMRWPVLINTLNYKVFISISHQACHCADIVSIMTGSIDKDHFENMDVDDESDDDDFDDWDWQEQHGGWKWNIIFIDIFNEWMNEWMTRSYLDSTISHL